MPKCGVPNNLYSKYNFENHTWSQTKSKENASLLELANRCVNANGQIVMWDSFSQHWITPKNAKKHAYNTWLHGKLNTKKVVDSDLIEHFFEGIKKSTITLPNGKKAVITVKDSCMPQLTGKIFIPYGPDFVCYEDGQYVNSETMSVVEGDENNIEVAKLYLRHIYRALCSGEKLSDNITVESNLIYKQVIENKITNKEFKFLINWLATIYQFPGINLQTNVWLVGEKQGIGKGTLVTVMQAVLGDNVVGKLSQSEIGRGWNDHIVGKILIEADEFDPMEGGRGPAGWNQWIKANTTAPKIKITQRGQNPYDYLNVANYIFTTNNEAPLKIDNTDRRNQFIKTTDDDSLRAEAVMIQTDIIHKNLKKLASGFSFILNNFKVNKTEANMAFINAAKTNVSMVNIDTVEDWVRNSEMLDRGTFISADTLYDRYKVWCDNYAGAEKPLSLRGWGLRMTSLTKEKAVFKKRTATGNQYSIEKIIPIVPTEVNTSNLEKALDSILHEKSSEIIKDDIIISETLDISKMSAIDKIRVAIKQQS